MLHITVMIYRMIILVITRTVETVIAVVEINVVIAEKDEEALL